QHEAVPRLGREEARFGGEAGVEVFVLADAREMGGEDLAGFRSSSHSLVKPPRHGLAEVVQCGDDEGLLAAEMGEDGAVGDTGFLRDIGGGGLEDAVTAEYQD